MIKYNSTKKILWFELKPNYNIASVANILSNIDTDLVLFQHEGGYMLADNKGKFHKLNKKIKIQL